MSLVRRIGLAAGPLLALAFYLALPARYADAAGAVVEFSPSGRATVGMMAWMAAWWMTEAVEIEVTALLPVLAFPLLGILPLPETAANYASDVIFLFLGGFVLALSIQRWGLDRRLAFLTLRMAGSRPDRIVAGCMGVTAFISMWVSNTATAAMMTPIALSVAELASRRRCGEGLAGIAGAPEEDADVRNFTMALLLSVAYASSIGGLGTIIGSPPNGILVRFLEQAHGIRIPFTTWMALGVPVLLVFLPVTWWMTTRLLFPTRIREIEGGRRFAEEEYRKLGKLNAGERATLIVFCAAVFLWMFRPLLAEIRAAGLSPFRHLSDTSVAVGAALALFLFPVDRAKGLFAADWSTAVRLPWGVLLLFGGGLALADAVVSNGVAAFLTSRARGLGGLPPVLVVAGLVTATVFLSEITSNTAQVATMLPILSALAPALGVPAPLLLVACTFGASLAFMMPVGTPPNAIVFGTGLVPLPRMLRAGIWLNAAGIVVVTVLAWLWLGPLLGVRVGSRGGMWYLPG